MLTRKQFAARHPDLDPVERAALWREYIAAHGVATGRPDGEALARQQQASAAGQSRSRRREQLAARREETFAAQAEEIDRLLTAAGWTLTAESESGSRYYERDGRHVRVSDHLPNEATARWMEQVACASVSTVAQAVEIAQTSRVL